MGVGTTVKVVALMAVPPGVVTRIWPLVAPPGTVVVIVVSSTTVSTDCVVKLKRTDVAPVKPVPVMVTGSPTPAAVGEKLVIVGGGKTVKLVALVAVPPAVTTFSGPVVEFVGTVVEIVVAFTTVNVGCGVPLKRTAVAPLKLVPVIVTEAPQTPLVGVKLVMVGGWNTVKLAALVAVPPAVTTCRSPVVEFVGTVVVIVVAFTTANVG